MSWTPEREEKLKELWKKGHTASQIAGLLGDTTRNAVIGKAHRLKLQARAVSKKSSTKISTESNNTSEVVDRNEFVGDIFIKPARSINYIQLNFVAVRTGVDFEEVVGKF